MRTKMACVSLAALAFGVPLAFAPSAGADVGRLVCQAYVDELAADAALADLSPAARENVADWVEVTNVQCRNGSDAAIVNVKMVRDRYNLGGTGQLTVVPSPSIGARDLD